MDVFNQVNWWTVLAGVLFFVGARQTLRGVGIWVSNARRTEPDMDRALTMIQAFQAAIVGLALVGFGLWIVTGATWILILALAVAGEEMLETSRIITALRADQRARGANARSASRQAPSR